MTIFFYGQNAYALRRELARMAAAYTAKNGSDMGVERLDGAAVKPRELAAALRAAPFLASSRLVIVESFSANKSLGTGAAAAGDVNKMLAAVPATTVVIFVEPAIDQRTAVFKALGKADKVVKFEALAPVTLPAWIAAEARRLGGSVEPAAARLLVEMAGGDQWRLAEEIQKLVNYDPAVTSVTVRLLVEPSVEQSVFEMVEAMSGGRVAAALAGYRRLLAARQGEIYMLTMIQWQLRNLLLAKAAPSGLTQAELAREAGMSPYVAGKMQSACRRHSLEALSRAFCAAADCEQDIKTGRARAEEAVEQLILRVAGGVTAD
jgi:DNA polymerase-3 subunit delta